MDAERCGGWPNQDLLGSISRPQCLGDPFGNLRRPKVSNTESDLLIPFYTLIEELVLVEFNWWMVVDEIGRDSKTGRVLVSVNPKYFRPAEVNTLCGDSTKAREKLGWDPDKTPLDKLIEHMMNHDLNVCGMLSEMRRNWPSLPIWSFRSAFLRETQQTDPSLGESLRSLDPSKPTQGP